MTGSLKKRSGNVLCFFKMGHTEYPKEAMFGWEERSGNRPPRTRAGKENSVSVCVIADITVNKQTPLH